MKRLALALLFCLFATPSLAQGCGPSNPNCVVPTAPVGTNNNQAASTAFVQAAIPAAGAITSLTGPVTAAGPGAAATTIAAGVVTNSNLANMAAGTIKGNCTNATGAPQDCASLIPVIPDQFCVVDRTGASDMGACINSTINAAQPATCGTAGNATVKLRAGTYLITTAIVPKSCVSIEGDGSGKTVLLSNTTQPYAQASGNQLVHHKLRGVTIKDNGTHATSVISAVINAGGTGYGNTLTGTLTWNGAGCSTNPVLNVTTNAGGNVVTINSIPTPGSCTTFPANAATTWTAGGGLSAGSNAAFNLQSANIAMLFTSLQGSILEDLDFDGYGSGTLMSVAGATNSSFSDTNGIWNSSNTFFNTARNWFAPNGCAKCVMLAGVYGGTPTASPPNSSNVPSIVNTQNQFEDMNFFGVSMSAFDLIKATDTFYIRKSVVWLNTNQAIAIQIGDDNANFPGNNYVNGLRAQISISLTGAATSSTFFRAGDWTFNNQIDLETDIAPGSIVAPAAAQTSVTQFKLDICGRNPFPTLVDASGFNTNRLCFANDYGSGNAGQGWYYRFNNGSVAAPIWGFINDTTNGYYLPSAGVFGFTKAVSSGSNGGVAGQYVWNGSTSGQETATVNATGTSIAFSGAVTLGSALAVASGGTGDTGTAWAAFTPSYTCGTATFTNNSSRSKTLGKTTWIEVDFVVATLGTCTNAVTFTLPNTTNSSGSINGSELVNTNAAAFCRHAGSTTTSTCVINGGTAYAANDRIIASGVYENQ